MKLLFLWLILAKISEIFKESLIYQLYLTKLVFCIILPTILLFLINNKPVVNGSIKGKPLTRLHAELNMSILRVKLTENYKMSPLCVSRSKKDYFTFNGEIVFGDDTARPYVDLNLDVWLLLLPSWVREYGREFSIVGHLDHPIEANIRTFGTAKGVSERYETGSKRGNVYGWRITVAGTNIDDVICLYKVIAELVEVPVVAPRPTETGRKGLRLRPKRIRRSSLCCAMACR
jgi:putative lipoic acid-binding regulatory protein